MGYDFKMIYDLIGIGIIFFVASLLMNGVTKYTSMRFFLAGFLLLIFMTYANSLIEHNWKLEYILQFISLQKVGKWLFRISASMGYLFMIFGITSLAALLIKQLTNRTNKVTK